MWPRRSRQPARSSAAIDRAASPEEADGAAQLLAEIERLTEQNRSNRSREAERRLLRIRHLTGIRLLDEAPSSPEFAAPDDDALPAGRPPEVDRSELTAGLLRAAILRDGCLLVRGLVGREEALRFADQIDRAYQERERHEAGQQAQPGYYEEFEEEPGGADPTRSWIKVGGGLLAPDSPMLSYEMLEMFSAAGVSQLALDYLGEPALISLHKTTLRKADPSVPGAWHQDGAFMGPVRSLNLWLSLSRCGDVAPGLDIVPRRIEHYVTTQTEEAVLSYMISQSKAKEAAGDTPIMRPIFEPGDALFFDELFLHETGSDPAMPNPRYAIESWFFGSSGFPREYAPFAV
jgi:hypothetical protein